MMRPFGFTLCLASAVALLATACGSVSEVNQPAASSSQPAARATSTPPATHEATSNGLPSTISAGAADDIVANQYPVWAAEADPNPSDTVSDVSATCDAAGGETFDCDVYFTLTTAITGSSTLNTKTEILGIYTYSATTGGTWRAEEIISTSSPSVSLG